MKPLCKTLFFTLQSLCIFLKFATEKGSVVAVLDAFDCKGCFVIAAIHPDRKHKQHTVNILASIYGKNRARWLCEQIEAGRLLYSDKEKALSLSRSARLQLPREVIVSEQGKNLSENRPKVKNYNHLKPLLTLKNKGKKHENK